jgi:hypothetical protein
MKIKTLSEVIFRFYSEGRPKATAMTFNERDIAQMVKLNFAELVRQQYYNSKKMDEYNRPDYSFVSPILSIKRFTLSDTNSRGMRRADMGEFDLFRLPKNEHFANVYFVGEGCDGFDTDEITQVETGEENFYINNPDLSSFKFYVVKGRGINTYNVSPCIKSVDIETTYSSDDIDIEMAMAYEIASAMLGLLLKIKQVPLKILDNNYAPQPTELKHRLQEAESNI